MSLVNTNRLRAIIVDPSKEQAMFQARSFVHCLVISAALSAVVVGTHLAVPAADKDDSRSKVKDLLKQKLTLLKQLHEAAKQAYRQGQGDAVALRQARLSMLQVQLALSETPQERIKLHEEMVQAARDHEKMVAELAKAAEVPSSELLKAKIHRLDAEIELEQAKAGAKASMP